MKILQVLRDFAVRKDGNTALIFALALTGLVTAIGGAVDLSRGLMLRTKMQDAGDSAVLEATLNATLSADQLKTLADNTFTQNLNTSALSGVSTTLTRSTTGNQNGFVYNVSANLRTSFLGLIGVDTIPIHIESVSSAGAPVTELALVLDNTGSMAYNNKMTQLKSSVTNILTSLVDGNGVNTSGIKVAVVPFDVQVKVAPSISYAWINYGYTSSNQNCASQGWPICQIGWDSLDKACLTATDAADCKSKAKVYALTYDVGSTHHAMTVVNSFQNNGGNFTEFTWTIDYWWTNGNVTCVSWGTYSSETGSGSYCTAYSGSSGPSGYATDSGGATVASDNSAYGQVPSGNFSLLANNEFNYVSAVGPGWGAGPAKSYTYSNHGHQGILTLPATADLRSQWPGCIDDREQNYDTNALAASSNPPHSLYHPVWCSYNSLQPVMPLTTDIAAVQTEVNAMQPQGNTNITIGVQWGMEVLSPDEPMTGGLAFHDPKVSKVMILVTDGYNNQNRYTTDIPSIDSRTAMACQAAKDNGITVFVVRLEDGDQSLLQNCASKPAYFFNLSNAAQLSSTMKSIFTTINKLRLTK